MFEGVTVAIVTPFAKGGVDFAKLADLVQWHVEQGTDAVLPCGTTGESPTLSHEEHDAVVDAVIKAAAGKVKVLAGAGSNSTSEALRLSKHAADSGADGVLVITPYYNKPTQEGLYRHFMAVADSVDIPMILYNVPGRTGTSVEPETVARLAQHDNIVGIKEATGSLDQASAICRIPGFTVLSGDDSLTLPIMSVGGKGVVSVVANIAAKEVKAMVDAANAGDAAAARERHLSLFPLAKAMFIETNPIPVKTAMRMLAMLNGEMRLPMCPMTESHEADLEQALKDHGLLT